MTASTQHAIHLLEPTDSVAVALRDLAPGEHLDAGERTVIVAQAIALGHKIALVDIAKDAVITIGTNTSLSDRMPDDVDVNAGAIVDAGVSIQDMGLRIYEALLDLASGKPSHSEELGYGSREFAPWQLGAVM